MEALLEIRNLCIGIRKEKHILSAVDDISFNIYPGEILGIVGESGSGKSLTALSIPGLLGKDAEVSGGSIFFYEENKNVSGGKGPGESSANRTGTARNLLTLPEKELEAIRGKEISMVFQEPFSSLNPLMKVGAQIAETLVLHENRVLHGGKDKARIKSKVRELMEKLGLPEPAKLAETYPHRLSGGMCQRVMIAQAIICRPRLLIADEPTTALDQNTQGQIISLMKEINRDLGTSILFISHDLEVIRSLCSRVLVMYAGRILEEGDTEGIFSRPAHEYTRGLLGSIPGRANRGKDLANIPGKVPSLDEGRPSGCPFHPRCAKAGPACKEDFPGPRSVGANHKTCCIMERIE